MSSGTTSGVITHAHPGILELTGTSIVNLGDQDESYRGDGMQVGILSLILLGYINKGGDY